MFCVAVYGHTTTKMDGEDKLRDSPPPISSSASMMVIPRTSFLLIHYHLIYHNKYFETLLIRVFRYVRCVKLAVPIYFYIHEDEEEYQL